MSKTVSAIPEGQHTITPHLIVRGAARAIDFYKAAFGAEEISRMPGPGGLLMHAEVKLGDSRVYLCDEMADMSGSSPQALGGSCVHIHLYTPDVDALFQRAVAAGAQVKMPPMDMFWGDRFCKITDPFGHEWGIATHKEDVSREEMEQRTSAFLEQMNRK